MLVNVHIYYVHIIYMQASGINENGGHKWKWWANNHTMSGHTKSITWPFFHFAVRECETRPHEVKWHWPPVGLTVAHWQSTNVGPPDSPTLGQRGPNGDLPLAQRRPAVGPALCQMWPTGGLLTLAYRWANGGPPVRPTDIGPMESPTLCQWRVSTFAKPRSQRWVNVGPMETCRWPNGDLPLAQRCANGGPPAVNWRWRNGE